MLTAVHKPSELSSGCCSNHPKGMVKRGMAAPSHTGNHPIEGVIHNRSLDGDWCWLVPQATHNGRDFTLGPLVARLGLTSPLVLALYHK